MSLIEIVLAALLVVIAVWVCHALGVPAVWLAVAVVVVLAVALLNRRRGAL